MTQLDPVAHTPVMLEETLEHLKLQAQKFYIDATFGAGGHSKAILETGACVLAIDQDPNTETYMSQIRQALSPDRKADFVSIHGNFEQLDRYAKEAGLSEVAGILMDLGVSSMQLDEGERGFAFRKDGPLDMRMKATGESAADVVNELEQEELAAIIFKYGEERYSRRIARAIVDAREKHQILSTQALANIIQQAYPKTGYRRDHPARRTFQALRIYVNDELGVLERALHAAEKVLSLQGRLVVLSYHSLEDRIVKHFMKNSMSLNVISKKPILASEEEARRNPRARSAKLRVAQRIML